MIRQILGRTRTAIKATTQIRYDALDLLRADHMKAEAMLIQLRLTKEPSRRKSIFSQVRLALQEHMRLEEQIFYPVCAEIPSLRGLVDHAHTDHQLVKAVLKDLAIIQPDSRRYDKLLTKLIIELERHVIEEENRMFAGVRKHLKRTEFLRLSREMLAFHAEASRPMRRAA